MACVLVVLVHTNLYARGFMAAWWPAAHQLAPVYGLAVPTFFLLSGHFAAAPGASVDGATLRRRLVRLGAPYVVWAALMLTLGVPTRVTGLGLLVAAIAGPGQLYYLVALAQLLGAAALLERRVSATRLAWAALIVSAGVYTAGSLTLWLGGPHGDERWFLDQGALWAVYFFVGALLRREPERIATLTRWGWVPLLLALPAERLYASAFLRQEAKWADARWLQALVEGLPFNLCGALALVALGPRLRPLGRFAPDTFGVYLAHMTVLVLGYDVLFHHDWTLVSPWETPLVGTGVLVLSIGLVRAGRRFLPRRVAAAFGFG